VDPDGIGSVVLVNVAKGLLKYGVSVFLVGDCYSVMVPEKSCGVC
jgi:hypothetical protein